MMTPPFGPLFLSMFITRGLANPLQALPPSANLSPQLPPTSNLSVPSELNISKADNANFEIQCNGEQFGVNPNILDCQSAMGFITPESKQYSWGTRHTGLGPDVFPLPFRIMGDRGLCFFQTVIIDDKVTTARASLGQIRSAASALILQCAANADSQGGVAINIGGDNNLAVVLSTYEPHNVKCRGTFGAEWSSCRDIVGDMPAGQNRMIFGPRGVPEVEQGLPLYIDSSDNTCVVRIYTTGNADVTRWYRIWEAVTSVFSICARDLKGGSVTGIGTLGNIFLTISSTATTTTTGIGNGSLLVA